MNPRLPDELDDFRSETPQAYFRFQDGILSIEVKPDSIIDLRTVERIERFRTEMTRGFEVPVLLIIPDNYLLLDKDAYQKFGAIESMEGCSAKAIVLKAPLRVLLRNFSLVFYRQSKPLRLFVSKSEAKMWLFDVTILADMPRIIQNKEAQES